MLILILLLSSFFSSCNLIRKELYRIPSDMKPRWVSIEYGNAKCLPLEGDEMNPIFNIPKDGFLCTSSAPYTSFLQRKFVLVDDIGNVSLINKDDRISMEGTLSKKEPSLDKGQADCNVVLDEFFYGSKDDLKSNNPIFQDEEFLTHYHPECRNTGVTIKKS